MHLAPLKTPSTYQKITLNSSIISTNYFKVLSSSNEIQNLNGKTWKMQKKVLTEYKLRSSVVINTRSFTLDIALK